MRDVEFQIICIKQVLEERAGKRLVKIARSWPLKKVSGSKFLRM